MKTAMTATWDELMKMSKVRPYVFKTRLQRAIIQTKKYGIEKERGDILKLCDELEEKLKYISDQSNQTSDGELRSYLVLKEDIQLIRNVL